MEAMMETTAARSAEARPRAGRLSRFLATDADWGAATARIALAIVIFAHGAQKLFGWFGGYGFEATLGWFTQSVGVPAPLAVLIILAESAGMVALAAGLAGRFLAGSIAAIMLGAVFITHLPHGFFMNWAGTQKGEGFEFHILAVALAAVVAIRGSGALSLDRWLSPRLARRGF